MNKTAFFLILMLFSCTLFSIEKLDQMRFTNRARCALDSKIPTESAFLLVSNMDVARSIYRLAKSREENTSLLTKQGIDVYRYSILELLDLIHRKIIENKLPLLPSDTTIEGVPNLYREIMSNCSSDSVCLQLDEYIQKLWSISNQKNPSSEILKYDNFDPKKYLINANIFDGTPNLKLKCHYLKKFSALDAQLYGSKPTKEMFDKLGNSLNTLDEYIADCRDFKAQENVKVASYQISLKNINSKKWDNYGFDYWNSLKIYFSWAFRNAPEMKKIAFPFSEIFKAVSIEDSVLMTSNNCKSITQPKCETDYLNANAIRQFANSDYKLNFSEFDFLDSIPDGPQLQMLEDPFTEVNKDILGFNKFENSTDWANNLRENFSTTRTTIRNNLLKSLTHLDISSKKLPTDRIQNDLIKFFSPVIKDPKNSNLMLKNELFYLCSEYTFTTDENFSFIRSKLMLLKDVSLLDKTAMTITDQRISELYNYFDAISVSVRNLCGSFDQTKVFENFEVDKTGFSKWYIEKVYENKYISTLESKNKEYIQKNKPTLYYGSYLKTKNMSDVICVHASDCARKSLKSILSIYSATLYADTFFNLDQKIKTPELFNPYAERSVCKVYDPWFKTKATLFSAFTDFIQGALATVAPGAIYGNFDITPLKVVSFNQLVKDGKIKYDAKYSKTKVQAGLALNFGNLLGVPCGVAISKTQNANPYDLLQFNGISVRACKSNEKNMITVNSPSDIVKDDPKSSSACLVCALNFEQIGSAATKFVPMGQASFFLIRGLVKLYKGLKDPLNIPHSWEVNPEYVKLSYNAFKGNIPSKCVRSLSKDRPCMPTSCEEDIVLHLNKNLNESRILSIDTNEVENGKAKVYIDKCSEPIQLSTFLHSLSETQFEDSERNCTVKIKSIPSGCRL